jgi:hypothetical protein
MALPPFDGPPGERGRGGKSLLHPFLSGVESTDPVTGYTHNFYRYPGRFSPAFARGAILAFSQPGEVVFDPFMGGGTTLVEARALGRHSVGSDISSLSRFLACVKTTPLSDAELQSVKRWVESLRPRLSLHNPPRRAEYWWKAGYQRNLPWPIRKSIELALAAIHELPAKRRQRFARCLLLKLGQWALDCRERIPSAAEFRDELSGYLESFILGMRGFRSAVKKNRPWGRANPACIRLRLPADKIDLTAFSSSLPARPNLVVTSPPYPGVYVLYHRWKVRGRKESPAPFWLADCLDGQGQAYYCFGHRKQAGLTFYFEGIRDSFAAVRGVVADKALVVQMLAFSEPEWQLPRYLNAMKEAGFSEVMPESLRLPVRGRLWRNVPGRRWFALIQGELATSREVVLFHRPSLG